MAELSESQEILLKRGYIKHNKPSKSPGTALSEMLKDNEHSRFLGTALGEILKHNEPSTSLSTVLGEMFKNNEEKEQIFSDLERGTMLTRPMGEEYIQIRLSKDTTTQPDSKIPGLWSSSVKPEFCCIYRVPDRLRKVNPEAYTPQMLLIGPLHHSKKVEAFKRYKTELRYLNYLNMELHKKKCLDSIGDIYGEQPVKEFRRLIEINEKFIRDSYAESTIWINTKDFVEMILHDSVFILMFFIQTGSTLNFSKKEDILFNQSRLINSTAILEDLILLENQLPYALLEKLFEPFFSNLDTKETFRDITLRAFGFEGKIKEEVRFQHFTDLFRCVRVSTLSLAEEQISIAKNEPPKSRKIMYNADKLDSAGVNFVNVDEENDLSLVITFKDGILKMPCFTVEDNTERVMRNLMALEQCHYPRTTYVCDYISFLDFLINTDQDVDLLVKKGIVKNWLGHQGSVTEMVNKLCLGLVDFGSHYCDIVENLNKHYDNRLNRSVGTLRRVYFKDLWTGTATIAAVVLLVLTLIQTVASILQVMMQNDNKSPPPPAPSRGL
ncbi:UPF0481 protein At3g47200 [Arabidopsis lyrata subsp. lyrata]|uniref:UPF0481 protein At3g47200 n=1 Tax=Arabidopsis lyrata subsp. lyrata TaxID=81972 RepID=UPI000A29A5B0|nr:UPF0481 protein At3g47200 [Arabidopsis lyrata subsp. lyrata]|eukprot:XP_020882964.1 UPF0481 protein At3g47200 [Arabidopsis lyrata subsp. lyrata]